MIEKIGFPGRTRTYNPSVNSLSLVVTEQRTYLYFQAVTRGCPYATLPQNTPLFDLALLKNPLK